MDIQYFHQKEMETGLFETGSDKRFTAAVGIPDIKTLLDTITSVGKTLTLSVGVAYVHPNDQYQKSIGRELAKDRLAPVEFKMRYAVVSPGLETGDYVYDLTLFSDNLSIEIRYKEHYFRPILRSVSIL